ncbi:MAG: NUDIX hydrolase [Candidatus Nomurabacteria bacterium]|nr:NUDIX hydrolase [Candidatus Nomurabacteria bacterium]USN87307.1 MAG: NUDIX hydrolase [Candidatus Nomurabacteria bacterium]
MDFHGAKIAILMDDKILMYLRDNKPGLFNANKWDFLGGGREGDETPIGCVIREVKEEIGLSLAEEAIVWEKIYPAQKDPNQKAVFMVAKLEKVDVGEINLTEGQKWRLFTQEEFFEREDVILALKERFRDYIGVCC